MGQYYYPIILEEKKQENDDEKIILWMCAHEYDNGLKLMEHSYILNDFVQTFEKLLTLRGGHYKSRVVWAGDYADKEPNVFYEYEGKQHEANLYDLCDGKNTITPKSTTTKQYPFIINHTKKLFVDKRKVTTAGDNKGWEIHPLPLLTCEGNGRGGGDYHIPEDKPEYNDIIGSWARDVISVEKTNPKENMSTIDYKELLFNPQEKM